MPEKRTLERARKDKRQGKAPSTQAGEFVKEEMEHIRRGKHGARNPKQAIAIGLSKARRAGVKLPPPSEGKTSQATRAKAQRDLERGQKGQTKTSARRSQARRTALKREGRSAASHQALSRQARSSARERGPANRRAAARKAVRTKGQQIHRRAA
ncbi:MAG: DNA-binding protein [Acidobacteria bacterium]|nr:DNA-binding protein [Acidobacteriota bacterium]